MSETPVKFEVGVTVIVPTVTLPVPVAGKVQTPALSALQVAGVPAPATLYVVFGASPWT